MAKVLLGILASLSVSVVWLNISPPQIAPWWDCRVGYMSKNMETRIRLLTSCLQDGELSDTNKAVIHFKRGTGFAVTGWQGRAIQDYNEAIRLRHDYADAYYNRGNSYRELNKYRLAMSDFSVAIFLNPRDANALHNRALLYLRNGERANAVLDLDEAIRLAPNHVKALFARGTVHMQSGEYDQAIKALSMAIDLKPNNAQYHLNRAWAYNKQENFDDAIRDVNIAIRQSEVSKKTYSADDISHIYDGFNSHSSAYYAELSERRRPQINLQSKALLVVVYAKKLKSRGKKEIEKTQMILRDLGYYTGAIDGVFSLDILSALVQCVAAVNCHIQVDEISGLK